MQTMDEWDPPSYSKNTKHEYALHTDSSVKKIFFKFSMGEFGSVTNKQSCSSDKPLGYYCALWSSQWAWQMGTLADFCSSKYDLSFLQSNSLQYLLKFTPMKTCSSLTTT